MLTANITVLNKHKTYAEIPDWANTFGIVLMTLVTIVGIIGNGLILFVQWKIRDKTSTDFLVLSMAGFEFYCSGFNNSLIVLHSFRDVWNSIISLPLCCFETFSLYLTSISTTFLLTATALDRYIQTCKPLNRYYSKAKAKWLCFTLVVSSIVLAGPSVGTVTLDEKTFDCLRNTEYIVLANIFDLFLSAAFLAMFGIVVVCYTKVTILLHRRHRRKEMVTSTNTSNRTQSLYHSSPTTSNRPLKISKNKVCPAIGEENQRNYQISCVSGDDSRNKTLELNNQDSSQSGNQSKFKETIRRKRSEQKVLNRTTLIMFFITTIYICTWLIHFIVTLMVSPYTSSGRAVLHLVANLYRINCMTNAIFYISMSSRFRQRAKQLFLRH